MKSENGLQVEPVPWSADGSFRAARSTCGGEMVDRYFPGAGWIRLDRETIDAPRPPTSPPRPCPPGDATVLSLLGWRAVTSLDDGPGRWADAVLYEGYVLYPYRGPRPAKNQKPLAVRGS